MNRITVLDKRKRRKGMDLRRDILAAAQQVFSEKGYAAASTREIAKRARAAESLIYRHFKNKSTLFARAVFEPIEQTLDENLGLSDIYYPESLSPEDRIKNYVKLVVGNIRRNRRLFIAYLNAITFHADEFQHLHAGPPSFQSRLVLLERLSLEHPQAAQFVWNDPHYEVRLVLIFLCSVALFDDLFFERTDQDEEREIRSIVKLIMMGTGIQQAKSTETLEEENRTLRTLLVNALLEAHGGKEGPAPSEDKANPKVVRVEKRAVRRR